MCKLNMRKNVFNGVNVILPSSKMINQLTSVVDMTNKV